MRKHRRQLRKSIVAGALVSSLGAVGAQAMPTSPAGQDINRGATYSQTAMTGPVAGDQVVGGQSFAIVRGDAGAAGDGAAETHGAGGNGSGTKADHGKGLANAEKGKGDMADNGPRQSNTGIGTSAAAREQHDGSAAGADHETGAAAAAAGQATSADDHATGAPGAVGIGTENASSGTDVSSDGGVSADSSAEAGLSVESEVDAQADATAAATAGMTNGESSVSATADADAAIAVDPTDGYTTRTKSWDNTVTTKFGEISLARSSQTVVLDDGTRVSAKSRSRALALDTPGVTKADASTRASMTLRDSGSNEGLTEASTQEQTPGDGGLGSVAISDTNAR